MRPGRVLEERCKGRPGEDAASADSALAALVCAVAGTDNDSDDARQIRHAYDIAERWHRGQWRCSGDPYITHPLAVARILAELGAGVPVLCAALLHDVLEDTPCTVAQLRSEVGAEVAHLVDQVTQLDSAHYSSMADTVAAVRGTGDDRVVLIKLADRLHNMRTLSYLTPAKQRRKSFEVLEAFVPLARALGLQSMERELVDLANATLAGSPPDQDAASQVGRASDTPVSRRLLATTAALLPAATRERWLMEWTGELYTLTTRRSRARFTIAMITGMPRLAVALRWPAPMAGDGSRR